MRTLCRGVTAAPGAAAGAAGAGAWSVAPPEAVSPRLAAFRRSPVAGSTLPAGEGAQASSTSAQTVARSASCLPQEGCIAPPGTQQPVGDRERILGRLASAMQDRGTRVVGSAGARGTVAPVDVAPSNRLKKARSPSPASEVRVEISLER